MSDMRTCVVVGASLAGLRGVEALRRKGFTGRLVLVGDEPHHPYDRPPLSKDVLRGETETHALTLRDRDTYADLDLDLRLGRRATALDPVRRVISLHTGETIDYDGCLIATGASVRMLPDQPELDGIFGLRTLDDALRLRAALERSPRRVCVIGAGFIGAEVAASCRARGLEVTVLEALPVPLGRVLPETIGRACATLHLDHGVDLRCGVGVAAIEGRDRVERVRLVDGSVVDCDVVVVGVGVTPNTGWLEGSGIALDNGVVCDEACGVRAADRASTFEGLVAAGDVARWRNVLFDEDMRIEHWTNAIEQSDAATTRLLNDARGEPTEPFAPVPYFWSDQYDVKIQFAGRAGPEHEMKIVDGSIAERKFCAVFGRRGVVTGVLAFSRPRLVVQYRRQIAERTSWDSV